jgi:AbrB family looped-hinge helix DNA binding protein
VASPERLVNLGPQGRLVVPAKFRRELGLEEGTTLVVSSDGRRLILEPRREVLRRVRARYAKIPRGTRLSAELIEDRREEVRRETER